MRIEESREFKKSYKKLPESIRVAFHKRLKLFLSDEHHPQLHNHKLNPPWDGYRSISITGDYRVVYEKLKDGYGFVRIGTHAELYE